MDANKQWDVHLELKQGEQKLAATMNANEAIAESKADGNEHRSP